MSVQKVPEIANARKATKLKLTISTMCAVMFALFAGAAMAQTAPAPAPGTQKPTSPAPTAPAPAAPAAQAPAAPAAPPKPFPEGAKIAYVSVQAIASNSVEGKPATSKLNDYQKKKASELGEKNKALQAAQTKLQQGGSVLNDQARSQLEKEIEKMNRDIQFFQQDAQTEGPGAPEPAAAGVPGQTESGPRTGGDRKGSPHGDRHHQLRRCLGQHRPRPHRRSHPPVRRVLQDGASQEVGAKSGSGSRDQGSENLEIWIAGLSEPRPDP